MGLGFVLDTQRAIRPGTEYDTYFPRPKGKTIVVKSHATVDDTLAFMPQLVIETLADTAQIAPLLRGKTLRETCRNIWHFVADHIEFERDQRGTEQVRRPARVWHDRKGDCDCMTVFVSSILTNLQIPHIYRITAYDGNRHYSHVYPVVPTGGKPDDYISLDVVSDSFDHEVPFTKLREIKMELQYLNGPDEQLPGDNLSLDAQALLDEETAFDLSATATAPHGQPGDLGKTFVGNALRSVAKAGGTVAHVANRVNPATALLRTGFLAAMKINLFHVAEKLRLAYLDSNQAAQRNIPTSQWAKARQVLSHASNIYFKAGGKPENLRMAILSGKGNEDGLVPGGEVSIATQAIADPARIPVTAADTERKRKKLRGLSGPTASDFSETGSLRLLLGEKIWQSEVGRFDGSNSLGEPVSVGASIAVASTTIAALATALANVERVQASAKRIGKGEPAPEFVPAVGPDGVQLPPAGEDEAAQATNDILADAERAGLIVPPELTRQLQDTGQAVAAAGGSIADVRNAVLDTVDPERTLLPTATPDPTDASENVRPSSGRSEQQEPPIDDSKGFLEKAGDWAKENPLLATAGAVAVTTGMYFGIRAIASAVKAQKNKNGANNPAAKKKPSRSLSGTKKSRRRKTTAATKGPVPRKRPRVTVRKGATPITREI